MLADGSQQRYHKLSKLGEGTYGVVYKAHDITTGGIVALKKIRLEAEEEGVPSTALREVSILKRLDHVNIVKLLCHIHRPEQHKLCLVFEFLDQDLKQHLDGLKKPMEPYRVREFSRQMLQGLLYCHQRRILHRDLKPQNLLIDNATGTLKLADFGLARTIGLPQFRAYSREVITLWYRAPEILLGFQPYTAAVDVWSAACIIAEMASNRPLFISDCEVDLIFKIFRTMGTPTEEIWPGVNHQLSLQINNCAFPKVFPPQNLAATISPDTHLLELIKAMMVYDPSRRVTAKKALELQYFSLRS